MHKDQIEDDKRFTFIENKIASIEVELIKKMKDLEDRKIPLSLDIRVDSLSCKQCFLLQQAEEVEEVPELMTSTGQYPDFVFPQQGESKPSAKQLKHMQLDTETECPLKCPFRSRPPQLHPITGEKYTSYCMEGLADNHFPYLPIHYQYFCYKGVIPAGLSLVSFIGNMAPNYMYYWGGQASNDKPTREEASFIPTLKERGEEYFQDAAVLEAVYHATGKLTVIELGAGTGRWLMYAYHANIQLRNLPIFLIGVEADWMHFHHLRSNLFVNGVQEYEMQLWRAAVGTKMGTARFTVGNSHGWYGQFLTSGDAKSGAPGAEKVSVVDVEVVDLVNLIEPHYRIDYLDFDIQYQERPVIEQAIDLIDERVRYMWVEIHEKNDCLPLRELMRTRGWIERYAACCKGEEKETPYGVSYRCDISAIFVKNMKLFN